MSLQSIWKTYSTALNHHQRDPLQYPLHRVIQALDLAFSRTEVTKCKQRTMHDYYTKSTIDHQASTPAYDYFGVTSNEMENVICSIKKPARSLLEDSAQLSIQTELYKLIYNKIGRSPYKIKKHVALSGPSYLDIVKAVITVASRPVSLHALKQQIYLKKEGGGRVNRHLLKVLREAVDDGVLIKNKGMYNLPKK